MSASSSSSASRGTPRGSWVTIRLVVATTGIQDGQRWDLADCLVWLFTEANQLYPSRSVASDGSIGDDSHSARKSDHNPNEDGWVLGADLTDDKMHGCDADALAQHIVASRDSRLSYVIWNDTIVKTYDSSRGPAWQPQPYTGENSHITHTHISVLDTPAAIADTSPWFPAPAPAPAPPPPSSAKETLVYRINWFKLGDSPGKSYRVLWAKTDSGKEVTVEAYQITDAASLQRWKDHGLAEVKEPLSPNTFTRIMDGPYKNVT